MILYFRFWIFLIFGHFKKRLDYCAQSELFFRVLPLDCASKTMNNARFFSFMDIAQHENNVRTGFLRVAIKENWRIVIRNSRITYFKPLRMFEKFKVTSQVVGWDQRFFYWKNEFLNLKGQLVALGYTAVSVRDRKKRSGVLPTDVISSIKPDLEPVASAEELARICSDLSDS